MVFLKELQSKEGVLNADITRVEVDKAVANEQARANRFETDMFAGIRAPVSP